MNPLDKILNWYFKRAALPYWCMLLLDLLIVFVSGLFVYYVSHRTSVMIARLVPITCTLLVYLVLTTLCFRIFRTYSGIVRYSSFVDLQRVGFANISALLLCIGAYYVMRETPSSRFARISVPLTVAMFFVATVLMWGVRVLVKVLYDVATSDKRAQRVLIYGAMTGGVGLAKNIRMEKPTRFVLKGFITHENRYRNNLLMGERVYSIEDDIAAVIREKDIDAVLVSPLRTDEFRKEQKLQDAIIGAGCRIYMATMAHEWDGSSDDFSAVQMKEVSVEDLLPREEIRVDMETVGRELTGKRILITGSAGSIGSEMVRQVAIYKPAAMMLIDQAETPEHDIRLMMERDYPDIPAETVVTSICHQGRMENIFREFKPDYVFHAAAYKHVPMMEDNPSAAVLNNVYGTKVIADLSVKYGVKKFVMVSTDKAVNPTNVMGCSKRICEIYVQSLDREIHSKESDQKRTQFVTTRFGNVLGSNGSVIPLFQEQIKKGGPVTVTHPDIIRYFMLIPEACKLVLEAGTKGHGGEIFVFDMGNPVRIADLAKRMIQLSGAQNIEVQFTGLRPGEKLYEEVLNEKENTKPSFHKKIRIAQVREYDYEQVLRDIEDLFQIAQRYDDMATVKKMKDIVPEYKSRNSKYEQLDQKEAPDDAETTAQGTPSL
ncbi:MAG: polysaccharide biosynthesis protein [Prevotella sp.]|nr:polysaccharide biosynthesis protein [Prevotella sp.]